jgi:hypothetical protein
MQRISTVLPPAEMVNEPPLIPYYPNLQSLIPRSSFCILHSSFLIPFLYSLISYYPNILLTQFLVLHSTFFVSQSLIPNHKLVGLAARSTSAQRHNQGSLGRLRRCEASRLCVSFRYNYRTAQRMNAVPKKRDAKNRVSTYYFVVILDS